MSPWISALIRQTLRHSMAIYDDDYLSLITIASNPLSIHPDEGDDCTLGLIGAPVPSTVCGPDLTCTRGSEEEHATCQYSERFIIFI